MSLLNWLFPKTPKAPAQRSGAPSATTRPPADSGERTQRREQLYLAVRDTMVRSGVLSSGYKFKVLSLDPAGHQFLVMIDIAPQHGTDVARQREMEQMLTQIARTRFHIQVMAVYWRVNGALGAAASRPDPATPAAAPPQPTPVSAAPALAAAVAAAAPPVWEPPARSGFEPIAPDEVAAFQQALRQGPATNAASRRAPVLEPEPEGDSQFDGFADTVIAEDEGPVPRLNPTQYGDLR